MGQAKTVANHYNELDPGTSRNCKAPAAHQSYTSGFITMLLHFAMKYRFRRDLDSLVITNEKIGFRFTGNHTIWAAFWNTFQLSQEKEFVQSSLVDIKPGNIIGTPLLVKAGDSAWVSLLEANVTDWACSGLMADTNP